MERQNMKCIIGLGNPGKKYAKTRHNIGFMMLDEFATSYQESFNQHKFKCNYSTMHLNGEKVLLIQPQTFMNLSGEGVRPLLDRKSTRLNSSHVANSYAVFCLKK